MPQSKGTATWLTNVRQDAPLERVRLDNSRARIENKRIDHEHDQNVEMIWLKHRRNKADMKFELKRAREEADRWRRMRAQLERNRVRSVIDPRRKERQLLRQQAEEANYAIIGPDGEIIQGSTQTRKSSAKRSKSFGIRKLSGTRISRTSVNGFSNMDGYFSQSSKRPITVGNYRQSQVFSSDESNDTSDDDGANDDSDDDVFNPYHNPSRKPSDSSKYEKPQGKQGRRKSTSTVGYYCGRKGSARSSISSEHDLHDSGKPGRSFQELKDLTHIDKITDNIKAGKRTEMLKLRETHQAQEHAKLQNRIETFYIDVETLKRKLTPAPKESDKLKPLGIASWTCN